MGIEIYVGHIAGNVTEEELRKLFSVAGTVTSVHLVKDSATGQYRGCGYVRMSTEDEAKESISLLNDALLGDSRIIVKDAPPKHGKKASLSARNKRGPHTSTVRNTREEKKRPKP